MWWCYRSNKCIFLLKKTMLRLVSGFLILLPTSWAEFVKTELIIQLNSSLQHIEHTFKTGVHCFYFCHTPKFYFKIVKTVMWKLQTENLAKITNHFSGRSRFCPLHPCLNQIFWLKNFHFLNCKNRKHVKITYHFSGRPRTTCPPQPGLKPHKVWPHPYLSACLSK